MNCRLSIGCARTGARYYRTKLRGCKISPSYLHRTFPENWTRSLMAISYPFFRRTEAVLFRARSVLKVFRITTKCFVTPPRNFQPKLTISAERSLKPRSRVAAATCTFLIRTLECTDRTLIHVVL